MEFHFQLNSLPFKVINLFWLAVELNSHIRTGFINQINCLVWKVPALNSITETKHFRKMNLKRKQEMQLELFLEESLLTSDIST